jgi:hypothetical protein
MNFDLILVTGPLVGASSWEPTADCLRAAGAHVEIPNVLSGLKNPPAWSEWTAHLTSLVPINGGQIFVGHSSASVLVAEMAGKFPCKGIIVVDGEVPPATGRTPPIRPSFRKYINGLADGDGELPPWSRWFSNDPRRERLVGIDILRSREKDFAIFESELPQMNLRWFDDEIELRSWDHVPAGFVQTSAIYEHAAEEALRRGWPVRRLSGTHLHPTLQPEETAAAIAETARELVSGKT